MRGISGKRLKVLAASTVAAAACLAGGVPSASAITLFATSLEGSAIVKVDTGTQVVSSFISTPSAADSLVFDSQGRVIYSQLNIGTVRRFDPSNNSDVLLASGMNLPADLVMEPGGTSVLISEFNGGKINRLNLNTNNLTTLASPGGNPEGLAYDSTGRLFANLGNRNGGPAGKFIAQLDPVTGAILNQTSGLDSLDGLTFDPFSGKLFASALFGGGFYVVDPSNLAGGVVSHLALISPSLPSPDGVTSDGAGNVYFASRGDSHIYVYNITGNTLTQNALVFGLDDLAPAVGLGSNNQGIPEPLTGGLSLVGLLALAGMSMARRRGA